MTADEAAPRERVAVELERRGWSARDAARASGVSEFIWSRFLRDGWLTPQVRQAVADAFGWDIGWPENLSPKSRSVDGSDIIAVLAGLAESLVDVGRQAAVSHGELADIRRDLASVHAKLDLLLEARPARAKARQAPRPEPADSEPRPPPGWRGPDCEASDGD
jgi:lambda repressor-like predicted transcriptional regulator